MRHYLSCNARTSHDVALCCNAPTSYYRFCWFVLLTPVIGGLLHSQLFDDKKLYKFGDSDVGSACQLAFGAFSSLATCYFLYVPLRAVELERKDPRNIVKAVVVTVDNMSETMESTRNGRKPRDDSEMNNLL